MMQHKRGGHSGQARGESTPSQFLDLGSVSNPVADAGFGDDHFWASWVLFDLAPELRHVDAQIVGLACRTQSPYFLQDLPVGEDFSSVPCQECQKPEFRWRQPHWLSAPAHFMARKVESERPDLEDRLGSITASRMTKRDPHAGEKLVHSEWFGEIVVRPRVERFNLVGFSPPRGQHQDGRATPLPYLANELHAIAIR